MNCRWHGTNMENSFMVWDSFPEPSFINPIISPNVFTSFPYNILRFIVWFTCRTSQVFPYYNSRRFTVRLSQQLSCFPLVLKYSRWRSCDCTFFTVLYKFIWDLRAVIFSFFVFSLSKYLSISSCEVHSPNSLTCFVAASNFSFLFRSLLLLTVVLTWCCVNDLAVILFFEVWRFSCDWSCWTLLS